MGRLRHLLNMGRPDPEHVSEGGHHFRDGTMPVHHHLHARLLNLRHNLLLFIPRQHLIERHVHTSLIIIAKVRYVTELRVVVDSVI